MGRGQPGALPQTEKREQFARLIAGGVSISEACRRVGVHRKTGIRWRHGRTITTSSGERRHYPSVIVPAAKEISPRFLSEDERVRLADLVRQGAGVRRIAKELGRSPSTISRELRRNGEESSGLYRPFAAHRRAGQRRARPGRGKLLGDPVLRGFVEDRLTKKWSPEQICQALRREFPDEPERHLVPETIYQAVYRPELGGLCRELPAVLRSRRRRRRPHRRADARRAGALGNMRMLDQRPAEAADRAVPGHWEGDLIVGSDNRSAIGTVVERASRFTMLLHLPDGRHTADAVRDALLATMQQLPPPLRRSLAWDQGKEMALHTEVAAALGMPVFFCDPHSPWQRGTNENTNGLLRQYFPKSSDLRVYTAADLEMVAAELNARPRKTLGWDTPAQRLGAVLPVSLQR
jgi:transposase, IS30 family